MLVGMAVGLIISLFQALTQIQEMTLTFVPKILAIFTSLLVFVNIIGGVLAAFSSKIIEMISHI